MENFVILKSCPLFEQLTDSEIAAFLKKYTKVYRSEKEEYLFLPGDAAIWFGVVLSGAVYIERTDYWGNRELLNKLCTGRIFGETFTVCKKPFSVGVKLERNTAVLLISTAAVTKREPFSGAEKIAKNLMTVLAAKNLQLNEKLQLIAGRTLRERVLNYLSSQAQKSDSADFFIPFNRQQLADYLAVDRSALSAVLSKLQAEGILDFHKNRFSLKHGISK